MARRCCGGAAAGRASWTPLITSLSGSDAARGNATGGLAGGGWRQRRAARRPRRRRRSPPASPPSGDKPEPAETPTNLARTEFVILFIWKENTPSDNLRPTTVIPAPEASTQGVAGRRHGRQWRGRHVRAAPAAEPAAARPAAPAAGPRVPAAVPRGDLQRPEPGESSSRCGRRDSSPPPGTPDANTGQSP